MVRLVLLAILLSSGASASAQHTHDYFPPKFPRDSIIFFTFLTTTGDTSYQTFSSIEMTNGKFLSKNFDENMFKSSHFVEDSIEKGLRTTYGSSFSIALDGSPIEEVVKSNQKINYPFIPIKELTGWSKKYKLSYSDKIELNSVVAFSNLDTIMLMGKSTPVLIMDRTVDKTWKGQYEKDEQSFSVKLYYAEGLGLVKFTSSGEPHYSSEVTKIEYEPKNKISYSQ